MTITIEDGKRGSELRKQAYFEFLDQIARVRRLIIELRKLEALDTKGINAIAMTRAENIKRQFELIQDAYPKFDAAKFKVQVCGS